MTESTSSLSLEPATRSLPGLARPVPARAGLLERLTLGSLEGLSRGRLQVELPDGTCRTLGAGKGAATLPLGIPAQARMRIHSRDFFKRCLLYGDIGFAESHVAGEWDSPDLTAVVAWFLNNVDEAPALSGSRRARALGLNWLRGVNRWIHLLRPNTPAEARRNIARHYDLSNDFFALFLDPGLMYSAGRYASAQATLEEAQEAKNDMLCRSLRLAPDDHVLEIGCGWGGWSLHAARRYGCRVTSVTISRQQAALARQRVHEAGLGDRIEVRLQDFREIGGRFDKIVSIEMMEALGHRFHGAFARKVASVLKRNGLLALQFITCPDSRYPSFRKGVDFIQKHVFPGSLLLSLNRVNHLLSASGDFVLHGMADMGHDYALTLRDWRRAFAARLGDVRRLGFDESFVRKWNYYLCYCEAAFAMRNISVVQTLHTRPNNLTLGG